MVGVNKSLKPKPNEKNTATANALNTQELNRRLTIKGEELQKKTKLIRKCEICGEEFEVGRGSPKTCSEDCRAKYQQQYWENYYLVHKDVVMRECVVCKKTFERKGNLQVCSENCRTVRDEQKAKDFYEKYKPIARQKKKEWKARMKAEEPLVEVEHRKLDGKVLHKAQMTVDEYNRTHGTNYSYGQYVHYVERDLI